LRFDKRYELRSNKVANVGTAPACGHEQIVRVGEGAKAGGKGRVEIPEILRLPCNLPGHALHDGKQILRAVRQLVHDELEMVFVALARRDISAQSQAGHRNADHEREQKKKRVVEV